MKSINDIGAFLIDLDGVLYVENTPIYGAVEAVNTLKETQLCRFLTNTSTLNRDSIARKLHDMGFNIEASEIFSAPHAALQYIKKKPNAKCKLFVSPDLKKDFVDVVQTETLPSFVVVGDIGPNWTYTMLNEILQDLLLGAELVAIHKNRFWQTDEGLQMDIGGFIAALEYASNKTATIVGKPNKNFFESAIADLGLEKSKIAVIGDDIDTDVAGAQSCGLVGILSKTGKYREDYFRESSVKPDIVIESIKYLPYLLKRLQGYRELPRSIDSDNEIDFE
jgi:HAD superfamily hydrolase (TIGR01458 family)